MPELRQPRFEDEGAATTTSERPFSGETLEEELERLEQEKAQRELEDRLEQERLEAEERAAEVAEEEERIQAEDISLIEALGSDKVEVRFVDPADKATYPQASSDGPSHQDKSGVPVASLPQRFIDGKSQNPDGTFVVDELMRLGNASPEGLARAQKHDNDLNTLQYHISEPFKSFNGDGKMWRTITRVNANGEEVARNYEIALPKKEAEEDDNGDLLPGGTSEGLGNALDSEDDEVVEDGLLDPNSDGLESLWAAQISELEKSKALKDAETQRVTALNVSPTLSATEPNVSVIAAQMPVSEIFATEPGVSAQPEAIKTPSLFTESFASAPSAVNTTENFALETDSFTLEVANLSTPEDSVISSLEHFANTEPVVSHEAAPGAIKVSSHELPVARGAVDLAVEVSATTSEIISEPVALVPEILSEESVAENSIATDAASEISNEFTINFSSGDLFKPEIVLAETMTNGAQTHTETFAQPVFETPTVEFDVAPEEAITESAPVTELHEDAMPSIESAAEVASILFPKEKSVPVEVVAVAPEIAPTQVVAIPAAPREAITLTFKKDIAQPTVARIEATKPKSVEVLKDEVPAAKAKEVVPPPAEKAEPIRLVRNEAAPIPVARKAEQKHVDQSPNVPSVEKSAGRILKFEDAVANKERRSPSLTPEILKTPVQKISNPLVRSKVPEAVQRRQEREELPTFASSVVRAREVARVTQEVHNFKPRSTAALSDIISQETRERRILDIEDLPEVGIRMLRRA